MNTWAVAVPPDCTALSIPLVPSLPLEPGGFFCPRYFLCSRSAAIKGRRTRYFELGLFHGQATTKNPMLPRPWACDSGLGRPTCPSSVCWVRSPYFGALNAPLPRSVSCGIDSSDRKPRSRSRVLLALQVFRRRRERSNKNSCRWYGSRGIRGILSARQKPGILRWACCETWH